MVTTAAGTVAQDPDLQSGEPDEPDEGPGWTSRWVRSDPVRAVAAALIAIQVIWRGGITASSFHTQDEFSFATFAAQSNLDYRYLFTLFNDHAMPLARLVAWLFTEWTGLAYWPYIAIVTALQAAVGIAFFRLLRKVLRPGWAILVPLCIMLFSSLTLEATDLWVVGLFMLPMQLGMILALGALAQYAYTKRLRHLISMGLALLLGLAATEKALLIAPMLFLAAACLFVGGGPVRSVLRATGRFWPAWLMVTVICGGYLWLYSTQPRSPMTQPKSAGEVTGFLADLFGSTFGPGLIGGPWSWTPSGDGPPFVDSLTFANYLAWAVILGFVIITVYMRQSAGRAWVLLAAFAGLNGALIAATRLGSPVAWLMGLVPRYVGEAVVVAAFCAGVALSGLRHEGPARKLPLPAEMRRPGVAAAGTIALVLLVATLSVGAILTTSRFADLAEKKQSRVFLENAETELRKAPPGTVFIDQAVSEAVVTGFYWPRNMHSQIFLPMDNGPVFVQEGEHPSVFDGQGHIRPAGVEGLKAPKGPASGCGYLVDAGKTARIPVGVNAFVWGWAIRIGYLSTGDTTATFRLGGATHTFPVHKGASQYLFHMEAGGDTVELSLADPSLTLCTDDLTIGKVIPA